MIAPKSSLSSSFPAGQLVYNGLEENERRDISPIRIDCTAVYRFGVRSTSGREQRQALR